VKCVGDELGKGRGEEERPCFVKAAAEASGRELASPNGRLDESKLRIMRSSGPPSSTHGPLLVRGR